MGSSHGFGSTTAYSYALLRLAFATASCVPLNLAYDRNSPVHAAKGTPSRINRASTTCKHTVSGTLSLPFRGTFHLSLMVLVHYRSLGSIYPWEMVLPDSNGISRVPLYSGSTSKKVPFQLRGYYPLWLAFTG